jgi:hypothetical protein
MLKTWQVGGSHRGLSLMGPFAPFACDIVARQRQAAEKKRGKCETDRKRNRTKPRRSS